MSAAGIARNLGAVRQGHNWRAPCPCECGYSFSLADGEDGHLLLYCFGGCPFDQIMSALVAYGLLDDNDGSLEAPTPVARQQEDGERRRRKIEQARELHASGVWDKRIKIYLRSRGIKYPPMACDLRFLEAAPHRLGAKLPAMLAPIVDVNGEQTGVHLTYVRPDGKAKADLPKEYQRECRGVIRGGAIRLSERDLDLELIVAEGLETAISAMQLFGRACWATVSASGMAAVELPLHVRDIIIAADNDPPPHAGQRAALALYDRLIAEGRSVRIKCPPDAGTDFNDVLGKRRGHAPH
jgi:putative DNA primase/helicase